MQEGLEARIATTIAPTLAAMGYEIVRVLIQGKQTPTVQIMADRTDGRPIGVADCTAISHAAGAVLDVDDPFTKEWHLEVSSPGIDRPLTRTKDWVRFIGQLATAEMSIPVEGRRRFRGFILAASDEEVRLKLEEGGEITLPRVDMRRAKLVMTDALIAATAAMAGVVHEDGEDPDPDGADDDSADDDDDSDGDDAGATPSAKRN